MTVYNFDVTNPDELSKIIWEMSNRIKDLEDKLAELKQIGVTKNDATKNGINEYLGKNALFHLREQP